MAATNLLTNSRFLTIKEASTTYHLSIASLHKYIRNGKLRAYRFGFYYLLDTTDLEAFLPTRKPVGRPAKISSNFD